ncbi:DMT family transporter [Saccharopolyspora sp. NPDC000995]
MVIAALLNASASVLQRRGTKELPESSGFSPKMLVDLIRHPVWVLGISAMLIGFVVHGIAITVSRIALVQPVLVTELPFTLVLASWAFRLRIPRRDWAAIWMLSVGLAIFLACLAPEGGDPRVATGTWAVGIAATAGPIIALVALGYRGQREHRAALLGVATGATFGLNSSLIAGVGASVAHGAGLLSTWQTYGVAVLGPLSFFLLQSALHAGNLVASQPGFTLTNPLVSVAWGLSVFGEQARGGWFLLGTTAGAVLIGVGTVVLSRSEMLNPDAPHRTPRR